MSSDEENETWIGTHVLFAADEACWEKESWQDDIGGGTFCVRKGVKKIEAVFRGHHVL